MHTRNAAVGEFVIEQLVVANAFQTLAEEAAKERPVLMIAVATESAKTVTIAYMQEPQSIKCVLLENQHKAVFGAQRNSDSVYAIVDFMDTIAL